MTNRHLTQCGCEQCEKKASDLLKYCNDVVNRYPNPSSKKIESCHNSLKIQNVPSGVIMAGLQAAQIVMRVEIQIDDAEPANFEYTYDRGLIDCRIKDETRLVVYNRYLMSVIANEFPHILRDAMKSAGLSDA